MDKLHDYQGIAGRFHQWRDNIKEYYEDFHDKKSTNLVDTVKRQLKGNASANKDYSHVFRTKTRSELVRVSAAVMGIEFSYAAETAFVSPTLLKIGVEHQHMTLVWALSPLVGFFLCPILGSLSDRCKLNIGRRRPFILLLSIGVIFAHRSKFFQSIAKICAALHQISKAELINQSQRSNNQSGEELGRAAAPQLHITKTAAALRLP
ncbi:membrane-associated transporter protein-like [Drosophila santomea]|uniref:membrane-associated transporter protein-like n=1 Tax=Drosophila santomea TaxID=129105 RepID=UPI0019535B77|nr:membrane-associated transporter protein-like [Drosophila santomea]